MNLIAVDSESASLVARQEAEPYWYPAATAPAARAQVWKRNADQHPTAATFLGIFELGIDFEIDFNPVTDRDVLLGVISLSPDGTPSVSRLEDAVWEPLSFERETVPVLGNDEHVPTVTQPPTISKAPSGDQWIVFTPAPDEEAATLKYGRIRVRKADDLGGAVFTPVIYNIPIAGFHYIPQEPFDCVIDYAWLGQSEEDVGEGRGWSEWSPTAASAGSAAAVQPPPAGQVIQTVTFDANDSMAAITRGVITE